MCVPRVNNNQLYLFKTYPDAGCCIFVTFQRNSFAFNDLLNASMLSGTIVIHLIVVDNDFSDLGYIAMTILSCAIVSTGVAGCDAWELKVTVVYLDSTVK